MQIVQRLSWHRVYTSWMTMLCVILMFIPVIQGQVITVDVHHATDDLNQDDFTIYDKSIDSLRIPIYVDSLVKSWKSDGYLTATKDTVTCITRSCSAILHKGYKYDQLHLRMDNQVRNLLSEAGLSKVRWINKIYDHQKIQSAMGEMLVYLENNGYPFARVQLDSIEIIENEISARLKVDKKHLILYDTIDMAGNANISLAFIERYLDIKPGQAYSLKQVLEIKKKINNLPYCRSKSDPTISFINKKAVVRLDLEAKQASRFDFIIGVLPGTAGADNKFTISGEFTGDLYNELGYGERIFAKFERLKPETQELELKFNLPYMFNLPFGIDTNFGLYRNSTNYLDLKSKVGFQYLFAGVNFIDASWYFESSRLIDIDTLAIQNSKKLPQQLDVNYTGGGIGINVEDLDYRYNPSKGWKTTLNTTVGIKSIVENNAILAITSGETTFKESYDTLQLKSFQAELRGGFEYYLPVAGFATLKTSISAAYKYNQKRLYDNELYRIGGNKLLRGFDEQSILSDLYAVATAEFRVVLDRNSYLSFPFIDYGRVRTLRDDKLEWEQILGFGMGLNFATGAGIFNVSFAVGKRAEIPLDFGATKIHFGYVSLF